MRAFGVLLLAAGLPVLLDSFGGHIAISSLELHPGVYQGALIECGVTDGVTVADLGLAYQAAAEYFAGAPLLDDTARPDLAARVSELWLPALGEPGRYTVQGERFDSVVKYLFGGDLPLRLQGLRQRYFPNMILFRRTQTLGRAGSTLHVPYRIDHVLLRLDPGGSHSGGPRRARRSYTRSSASRAPSTPSGSKRRRIRLGASLSYRSCSPASEPDC